MHTTRKRKHDEISLTDVTDNFVQEVVEKPERFVGAPGEDLKESVKLTLKQLYDYGLL